MTDYFKFLENLKVGDEVLLQDYGYRIFKISGMNDHYFALDNGFLFDRLTGHLNTKKKDRFSSLVELTDEGRETIKKLKEKEEKEAKEQQEKELINDEYEKVFGMNYYFRANQPSFEEKKELMKFLKDLRKKNKTKNTD